MNAASFAHLTLAVLALASPCRAAGPGTQAPPAPLAGDWQGTLDAGMARLRLVLHLTADADGGLSATMDSPDQGALGLRVDEVKIEAQRFSLTMRALGARFEATIESGEGKLVGSWSQGPTSLPLTLERTTTPVAPPSRPQEPKGTLPYEAESVRYRNEAAGLDLDATLTTPKGAGPFPAVVLITGSGPEDRDEAIFGHKPFLVLADHLTRCGIAVLRSDDRGVGGSGTGPAGATSQDLADDVDAAIAFLASRRGIDATRIGLLGHSEGGIIAGIVAARSARIAFIVGLASPAVRGDALLLLQNEALARGMGVNDAAIAAARRVNATVYGIVASEEDPEKRGARVREALSSAGLSDVAIDAQMKTVMSPWLRFFLRHDPADSLARLGAPTLLLFGEKDRQVPAEANAAAARTALARNPKGQVEILPDLNHLFQECKTGNPDEYVRIEQTLSPTALERVSTWIRSVVGRAR